MLIAEACSHHPIGEDIGRVKIPRWLTQYTGQKINFEHVQGRDFPEDLSPYKLVIHCGACMWNRREMLGRILRCQQAGVPITNYGLTIAYSLGIFERALQPFPAALDVFRDGATFIPPVRTARRPPRKETGARMSTAMDTSDILGWLREEDPERLQELWQPPTRRAGGTSAMRSICAGW